MAKNPTRASDDEGFARAYWDSLEDTEKLWSVQVICMCCLDRRRGVLRFVWQALDELYAEEAHVCCSYTGEFPNSRTGTLASFLFQGINRLERCVADYRHDQGLGASTRHTR